LLSSAEKFGQYNSLGLKWAKKISEVFTEKVTSARSVEGVQFVPGLFSWARTIYFGEKVGATPDGRYAGAPINHGANPMPGAVKSGEMTTMSEAIAAVQPGWGNTAPFQMELDPGLTDTEGGVEKVMALLETHLKQGGTLINVNIVDADKIRAAHENPELFPDLVVRVTGFTAYFISLTPEFRKLVVDRIMEAC
jgi:formate C-acetyltransferase